MNLPVYYQCLPCIHCRCTREAVTCLLTNTACMKRCAKYDPIRGRPEKEWKK